jgi:hypothetical protein
VFLLPDVLVLQFPMSSLRGNPLSHEDDDICSSAPMPTSNGQVDSRQARTTNVKICASKESNVLDARLMEMQFGRQLLGANQLRMWDPMVEEAALCVGRQSSKKGISVVAEQPTKEPLETNVENSSFTPLSFARSLCGVDHLPPAEGVVGHLSPRYPISYVI